MKDNQYYQGNEYSQSNEYYQGNEVSVNNNEYYKGADEWYQEKDETATLSEEIIRTPTLQKDKSDEDKARKKKRERLNKTAGITASAVAVVLVVSALNITGSSYNTGICPYCFYSDCDYWDFHHDGESIRISLEGDTFTAATDDKYQMGMLQEELDKLGHSMQTRTIWMEDGRRAYMQVSSAGEDISYEHSWDIDWSKEHSTGPQTEKASQSILFFSDKRTGWIRESIRLYTLAELLYLPDGSTPDDEVYYKEIPDDVELPYVEMKKIDGEEYLWFRVASNDVNTNISGILERCELYIVDSGVDSYDLGDTMLFRETEGVKRVWGDDSSYGVTHLYYEAQMTVQEHYSHVEYVIDAGRHFTFAFSNTTYEEIYERWELLNEQAPRRGHKVIVPVYQLDDYEYGGITYQVFVRDKESLLNRGYDLILSPVQEKNFSVQTYMSMKDTSGLYDGNSLESIIREYDLAELEQILGCITLR